VHLLGAPNMVVIHRSGAAIHRVAPNPAVEVLWSGLPVQTTVIEGEPIGFSVAKEGI